MAGHSNSRFRSQRGVAAFHRLVLALWLPVFCAGALTLRAELQFDVFLGYDGIVPQASWFPVVCEIKNDGPPFVGTVELDGGRFNQEQTRRAVVELPTGTLKRFVIPVFSTTRSFGSWDVRLLDERGKVRAEQTGLQAQAARSRPTRRWSARWCGRRRARRCSGRSCRRTQRCSRRRRGCCRRFSRTTRWCWRGWIAFI